MKKLYLLAALACLTSYSQAQLTVNAIAADPVICSGNSTSIAATATPVGYTVTAIPINAQPLQGINYLCASGVAVTPLTIGTLDDGRWDNISLPFTFTFYGNTYNSINISTNGWIGMGSTNTVTTGMGMTLASASAPNDVIHAITADLNFKSPTTSAIEYFEDGFAPNRIFVIDFSNIKFFSGGGTANVQVILYEGTNVVEIHTTDCTNTTLGKAQGVENSTGTVAAVSTGRNNSLTWSGMPNAYRFTPDVVNFTWSPATGLSSTTGPNVTANPTTTTTYTINATNPSNGWTGSTNVTVTIDPASYTLAATAGGSQVCQNIVVSGSGTSFRDGNCNLIAKVVPAGASPVSNSINTCVTLYSGSTKRGTTTLYGPRQYDIEPIVSPTTSTANITLYYLQSEFNNFNTKAADSGHKLLPVGPGDATGISNLMIRQFHGTGTNPLNYTGSSQDFTTATAGFTVVWNATRNWWEVTVPVTGFSGFYLTSKIAASLPINLVYFKGVQVGKKHLLNWKVNCTSAEAKFEITRSADGVNYSVISTMTASQLRCNEPFDYTDEFPLKGTNYYRIKMIDVDAKATYSNVVQLTLKTSQFDMVSINPNIVRNEDAKLRINAVEKNEVKINITDMTGRTLQQQTVILQPGLNDISISSKGLSAGAYMVTAYVAGEKPQTLRLIKQ